MKEFFDIDTPYSSEEYKIMDIACKNRANFPLSNFAKSPVFSNKYRWSIHNSELPTLYSKLESMYDSTGNDDVLTWLEDIQATAAKYEPGPTEPAEPNYDMNEEDMVMPEIQNSIEENVPQQSALERFVNLISPMEVDENSSKNLVNMHGVNLKPSTLDEVTDTERYEDVVFMQGDEADEALETLSNFGPEAALKYLIQWHNPGEGMGSDQESHGKSDKVYRKDGYIMSWNPSLEYIGLQYDTKHNVSEDNHMYRHIAGQREKTVPLGKHGPHSPHSQSAS